MTVLKSQEWEKYKQTKTVPEFTRERDERVTLLVDSSINNHLLSFLQELDPSYILAS